MKVLDRAGVALELILGPPSSPAPLRWDEFTSSGEFLGGTGIHSQFTELYGWPSIGVTRTRLQTLLLDTCRQRGIPVHVGWKLAAYVENDEGIVARAEDGREVRADFIVGADGLKSRTRELLLEKRGIQIDEPLFTHIIVRGGCSPIPASLKDVPAIRIWYGATEAMISHPLENGLSVWGLTCDARDATSESWRTVPAAELDHEIKMTLGQLEGWPESVRELVSTSTKIMTIGLYDRPELPVEHWYYSRGVLIGDAAHPTTYVWTIPHV
jgi:salicylate hydroxylase